MILYHVGKRLPTPFSLVRYEHRTRWSRGVFLTPEWRQVVEYFGGRNETSKGKAKRLYVFEVSMSIVRRAGGFRKVANATEIIIPEELWGEVKFLGSSEIPKILPGKNRGEDLHHNLMESKISREIDYISHVLSERSGMSIKAAYTAVLGRDKLLSLRNQKMILDIRREYYRLADDEGNLPV